MAYQGRGINTAGGTKEDSLGAAIAQQTTLFGLVDMVKSFSASNRNMVRILVHAYGRYKCNQTWGVVLYSNCTEHQGPINLALVTWDAEKSNFFYEKPKKQLKWEIWYRLV